MQYTYKAEIATGQLIEDCKVTIGYSWTLVGVSEVTCVYLKVISGEVRYRPNLDPQCKSVLLANGPLLRLNGKVYVKSVGSKKAELALYRFEKDALKET